MAVCKNCGFSEIPQHVQAHEYDHTNDPRERLANLESEITCVQSLLQELVQKRVPLKLEINAIASPILQLPPEISSQIFVTALSASARNGPHGWRISPLFFGKICRLWREIAWTTPELWNSLQLNLKLKTDLHNVTVLVDEWLGRSMGQPLDISVLYVNGDQTAMALNGTAAPAVIDVIARYSRQWQKIKLQLPESFYDSLKCVQNRLPLLQFISVRRIDPHTQDNVPEVIMFSHAPQLHAAQLECYIPSSIMLPTNQLTTLSLSFATLRECLNMLGRSPDVTECVFRGPSDSADWQPLHVHAAQLRSLELTDIYGISFDVVFTLDHLTAPALCKLVCRGRHVQRQRTPLPHRSFISLIHRSCSLESLLIKDLRISTDNDLINCLEAVPTLTELSLLNVVNITNETFQMLDSRHSDFSRGLLPNLTTLEYAGSLLDFHCLSSFLRSRWETGKRSPSDEEATRLQFVNIETYTRGRPDDDTLAQLNQLAKEGMKISLVTANGQWI